MSQQPLHLLGTDPEAFEAFYREHVELVQRFVARRVADPSTASDLTADVFVAVIESGHRYRPSQGPPVAWLYGIARNVVAREVRREGRALDLTRRVAGRRHLDEDSTARIHERLDAERETRRLYSALADLPEHERALLELVAVDGLSIADAARSLGIKPATARVRMHRARRALHATARPVLDRALTSQELA